MLLVIGNITSQKFISIPIGDIHIFELSIGATVFPLTFLITDLVTEFYGKERAVFCVRSAIFVNIVAACIITLMNHVPAANWSKINDHTFNDVFGIYSLLFIGSTMSSYISQLLDTNIYLTLKAWTKGRHLWLRNNLSTAISLLLDTSVVIIFLAALDVLPKEQAIPLIINGYIFKLIFTISNTPIFYAAVICIRSYIYRNPD
jgi:uncharacterized integral membrane protein (TIGR00697 family)